MCSVWSDVRSRFPAVAKCTYLNTAAGGPVSVAAAAAGRGYYDATCQDGDVHWDDWLDRVEQVRHDAARFVGARSAEIGFVSNASAGLNLVAGMLRGEGRVVAVRGDFPSVTLPWMQQGYEVDFVEPEPTGAASLAALEAAVGPSTGVLALGWVHYRTGYRYDLDQVGELCRRHGLALVVDATQGLGALPVDLATVNVDFLVASGYKWLTAGYGVGMIYVSERRLEASRFPAVGWRSARDPYALASDHLDLADAAGALELGHPPFAGVFALGAALELFGQVGPAVIAARVLELSGYLRESLAGRGLQVAPAAAASQRSGIVFVGCEGARERREALAARGILVSARGNGIRVSAHLYNNRNDIDALLDAWH